MTFCIRGDGPQFPNGYEMTAKTASEALTKFHAVAALCGSARTFDANGQELTEDELFAKEQAENA